MTQPKTLREASCADDYDPNSMPVERARALIRTFLSPVTATERVHIRAALSRVLAADVMSPLDVPGHDNSAMDGYAVRFADLVPGGETVLARVGESFAGKPPTATVGAGQCVRIFTGGVMPAGADSVVMQERAREDAAGVHVEAGAVGKAGQNRRFAGEDVKRGQVVFHAGQPLHPAELGMLASLGIGEVDGVPSAARRVLLDRRRAEVDRHAARRGRDLRQQPLHAVRDAYPARLRNRRHGRRPRRARGARARVRDRRRAARTSSSRRAASRWAKPTT